VEAGASCLSTSWGKAAPPPGQAPGPLLPTTSTPCPYERGRTPCHFNLDSVLQTLYATYWLFCWIGSAIFVSVSCLTGGKSCHIFVQVTRTAATTPPISPNTIPLLPAGWRKMFLNVFIVFLEPPLVTKRPQYMTYRIQFFCASLFHFKFIHQIGSKVCEVLPIITW
jgi:hypothetical protein